ncbi:ferredoxin [Rhodobacteraceae bacterium]|nr:ferredoxin [Paracoccaceae bacterium]
MPLDRIEALAKPHHLTCFGALHATADDNVGRGTIVLLGPAEPGFWPHFTASSEYNDGAPDPVDRWSTRVITEMADELGATALFPFGQPARPFIGWALRTGQAFVSPAAMLVHAKAGLLVSYRGALLLPEEIPLPGPMANPCDTCADKPCLTACPVQAITDQGYNLPACHSFLDSAQGTTCMSQGCTVRRYCPLGQNYPRLPQHSAYHMKVFHS